MKKKDAFLVLPRIINQIKEGVHRNVEGEGEGEIQMDSLD